MKSFYSRQSFTLNLSILGQITSSAAFGFGVIRGSSDRPSTPA